MKSKSPAKKIISYGFHQDAQLRAVNPELLKNISVSDIYFENKRLGELKLNIPGYHNISNALAAIATTMELGINFNDIIEILSHFRGVKRRQELIANLNDIFMIIDDYGHHPSEIKATLEAIHRGWPDRRIITVFQPHRYSRTQLLLEQFGNSFQDSDIVIINDIYPANENPIPGITAELVYQKIKKFKKDNVFYLAGKEETISFLIDLIANGDIVLTMGAGDVWKIGKQLAKDLKSTKTKVGIGG